MRDAVVLPFEERCLVTEITESKVCQPLYRELEPLDGVVLIYILIFDVIRLDNYRRGMKLPERYERAGSRGVP